MPEPEQGAEAGSALRGCRVLVARPAAQAVALCALIEAAGGIAQSLPMIEIEPVAHTDAAAALLHAARAAERWIFSSTNAVHYAAMLAPPPWPPSAAVGAATAAALEALGQADVLRPATGDGAAALLDHPALAQVAGQHIALISGERPLPELEVRLRERGARPSLIAVYRRVPLNHAPEVLAQAIAQTDIAILPSGEALEQLVALTPVSARAALFALQLALPSPRVVEKARELGFRRTPLLPQRVTDAAYVELLRHYRAAGTMPPNRPSDRA